MNFSYLAQAPSGQKQKGIIKANSQKEVVDYLVANSLTPITIKKAQPSAFENILVFGKVRNADIVLFTRQLSSMITTGLTLLEALDTLRRQAKKPRMRLVINDIMRGISEGKTFAQALSDYDELFSSFYIALVKAAETGGMMDKVLERLADTLERSEDLKKQIQSALFYPAIIVIGIIIVVAIMNIVVIPQLGTLYKGLGVELPLPTRIVLAISSVFANYYFLAIPFIVLLPVFYSRLTKTDYGLRLVDKMKLRLPVFGPIITLGILSEISRTLSLLIGSGASIIESLITTADVANNIWYKQAMEKSAQLVESGTSTSKALENQNIFPIIFIQMVQVGEATGKIDEQLFRVSGYFERDLSLRLKTITTALEPIIIAVLGAVIGFLILSIILPIYSIISQVS